MKHHGLPEDFAPHPSPDDKARIRRNHKQWLRRLRAKALAGSADDETIKKLALFLPGDRWACLPTRCTKDGFRMARTIRTWPYTRACFGRDLAARGHPLARRILLGAWSDCHLTTIGSLGGAEALVAVLESVRSDDPYIPELPEQLTVWRGQGRDNPGYGLSWTRDREVARQFAENFWPARGGDVSKAVVVERTVRPDEVLAVVGEDEGRNEAEILLRSRLAPEV